MTYRDAVMALLDEEPGLAAAPEVIAERVGCAEATAVNYRDEWRHVNAFEWVVEAVAACRPCGECGYEAACAVLDALELPVLCERVTARDVELARLHGLEGLVLGRARQRHLTTDFTDDTDGNGKRLTT